MTKFSPISNNEINSQPVSFGHGVCQHFSKFDAQQLEWQFAESEILLRKKRAFYLKLKTRARLCVHSPQGHTLALYPLWWIKSNTVRSENSAKKQLLGSAERMSEAHCFGACRSYSHTRRKQPTAGRGDTRSDASLTRSLSRPLCVRLKIATWLWVVDGRGVYICVFEPDR